jgi:hypothetical protein
VNSYFSETNCYKNLGKWQTRCHLSFLIVLIKQTKNVWRYQIKEWLAMQWPSHSVKRTKRQYNEGIIHYYTEKLQLSTCYSILCFLCSVLWFLVCIRVHVTQSYVFCVVFRDPFFASWFVLNPPQTTDHKTLCRKHKIEQHERNYNQEITKHCTENIRLSKSNLSTNVLLNLMFSV